MDELKVKIDYKIIGQRIKEVRKEQGVTQSKLADELDVSVAFLSRIERGASEISLKRLMQICSILNVPIGRILSGAEKENNVYLFKEFDELLESCSPEKRRLIYNIAKAIAGIKL